MEDTNFEFLIDNYPRCYMFCKRMDYFIHMEFFEDAATNARKAVEGMVKYVDRYMDPENYADYSITRGKYFTDHIKDLETKKVYDKEIREDIFTIWKKCSSSAHPDKKNDLSKGSLAYYAKLTHKILKYLFNYMESDETDSVYTPIKGDEDWILENEEESEKVKELESDIKKKEEEINNFREKYSDLKESYDNEKEKYLSEIKKLEASVEALKQAGMDEEVLKATIKTIKAQMKQKEDDFKAQEAQRISDMDELKSEYESREKELSDQIDNLKEELENSIFDLSDLGISDNDKSVVQIQYPPVNLPSSSKSIQYQIDPLQIKAFQSKSKKLVIEAGPGSGKTFVIIKRIQYLIEKYDPDSFLVITFTEKAANELKNRLKDDLPPEIVDKIHVSTIHSFCRTFLRDNSSLEINILDEDSRNIFIKSTFAEKFSGASYIPPNEYRAVFQTFDECSTFQCNYDAWINSIIERYKLDGDNPANKRYYDLLKSEGLGSEDFVFPESYVRSSNFYNERWYAHKYLAVAEAAKEYQMVLRKNYLYDFDRLQRVTLSFLKHNFKDLKINYSNILVDEFQDTDIVQKEIFELLLENANTFTIVGDVDQSIYRWRGSNNTFLDEFAEKDGFEKVILNSNYRSAKSIVEFNEEFISREDDDKKLVSARSDNAEGAVYYLDSFNLDMQARKIVEIIKYLHENNGVKYSDIGLLFRSTLSHKIRELISRFEEEGINYVVKGNQDFDSEDYYEVKAFIHLLWYFTDSMDYLSLTDFSIAISPIYKFSEDTIRILAKESENARELSQMNRKDLENLGIKGDDYEFLLKLNDLKRSFNYPAEENDRITILGLYNNLFKITAFVDDQFREKDSEGYNVPNNRKLLNLSLISKIIKNYMDTVDEYDIDGLVKYLIESYGTYTSPYNEKDKEDAVQLLTVHKAKGLEFPVVILCTLQEYTFPIGYFKKKYETNFNNEFISYPVFNKYLRLKTKDDERSEHNAEEKRVVYVGTTRAEDLLIVSSVLHKERTSSKELRRIKNMGVKELKIDDLDVLKDLKIKSTSSRKSFNKPILSYSSYNDYTDCKHKYDLIHNIGFQADSSLEAQVGNIVHDLLNKIHTMSKNYGFVPDDFIDEIIEHVYITNPFLKEEERFENIIESIKEYWRYYGSTWKILDTELPFSFVEAKYDFTGKIDLIVQEDPDVKEITVVDFKITNDERLGFPGVRDKYRHQLQLYAHALRRDPRFKDDYEINKLKIFQIDGENIVDDPANNFEVDDEDIEILIGSLENCIDEMYDGIYDKNLKSCNMCHLKDLCNLDKIIF